MSLLNSLTKNKFSIHNISFELKNSVYSLCEFKNMMLQYFLAVFFEKFIHDLNKCCAVIFFPV